MTEIPNCLDPFSLPACLTPAPLPAVDKLASPPSDNENTNLWIVIGVVVPLIVVTVLYLPLSPPSPWLDRKSTRLNSSH